MLTKPDFIRLFSNDALTNFRKFSEERDIEIEINAFVTCLDRLLGLLTFSIRSILQPKKSHADLKNKSLKLRLSSLIVAREGIEPPSASGGYEP
jgi:hypothetical protein